MFLQKTIGAVTYWTPSEEGRLMSGDCPNKEKWFQVTHQTARYPTGMPGLNMACSVVETLLFCSPQPPLVGYGLTLQSPSAFSSC